MCLPFNKQVDFGTQSNPTKKEHLILSKKIYIKDLQKDIYFFSISRISERYQITFSCKVLHAVFLKMPAYFCIICINVKSERKAEESVLLIKSAFFLFPLKKES